MSGADAKLRFKHFAELAELETEDTCNDFGYNGYVKKTYTIIANNTKFVIVHKRNCIKGKRANSASDTDKYYYINDIKVEWNIFRDNYLKAVEDEKGNKTS